MTGLVKSIRVDAGLWAEVEAHAKAKGVTANAAVSSLLRQALDGSSPAMAPSRPAGPRGQVSVGRAAPRSKTTTVVSRGRHVGFDPGTNEPIYRTAPKAPAPS